MEEKQLIEVSRIYAKKHMLQSHFCGILVWDCPCGEENWNHHFFREENEVDAICKKCGKMVVVR